MDKVSFQNKYKLKELELNALLEITQAINSNLPEVSLFKIYAFTLRGNLRVRKMALYVLDKTWKCVTHFGTTGTCAHTPLDETFLQSKMLMEIGSRADVFGEFDFLIPVYHKTSILAVVFIGGVPGDYDEEAKKSSIRFIQALSNIIIVAIENKKLARQQLRQEALRKELEIASEVQQFLFPDRLPYDKGLRIEASYLPHDEVGGDYYDYIPIDENRFLVCIADVSGKGVPAALIMSNFQASLRTLIRQTDSLKEIVSELNFRVLENAKGEKFITFFTAIYDRRLKSLLYINSGHNPPLLVTPGGVRHLHEGSTVLGAIDPLPFINEELITDMDDFLIFCYTDGLTETCNNNEEEFGPERLWEYFSNGHPKDLKALHQDVIIRLDEFKESQGYHDDITMLSVKVGD